MLELLTDCALSLRRQLAELAEQAPGLVLLLRRKLIECLIPEALLAPLLRSQTVVVLELLFELLASFGRQLFQRFLPLVGRHAVESVDRSPRNPVALLVEVGRHVRCRTFRRLLGRTVFRALRSQTRR